MLIYKAILNGKAYVGLFSGKPSQLGKRKREHKTDALQNRDNTYFHNAICKHGWENVKFEILEKNIEDFELLKEREKFNILKYDTYRPNGYNMTLGGEGIYGYRHTEESKRQIGLIHKGKIVSKETIEKFRSTINSYTTEQKNLIFQNRSKAHVGQLVPEERKIRISNSTKGRVFTAEHRKKIAETRRKIYTKECKNCGHIFTGTFRTKYCSKKCRDHSLYVTYWIKHTKEVTMRS